VFGNDIATVASAKALWILLFHLGSHHCYGYDTKIDLGSMPAEVLTLLPHVSICTLIIEGLSVESYTRIKVAQMKDEMMCIPPVVNTD
jgi:hypothetical protein